MDPVELLHKLVLAIGHDYRCPQAQPVIACSCGKAAVLRLAHGEACDLLRSLGRIK